MRQAKDYAVMRATRQSKAYAVMRATLQAKNYAVMRATGQQDILLCIVITQSTV
ncbi:MAG: hypothetical protein RBS43_03790 [Candidatus Cloacimonas sp.]|nr:hypothetical protein [Candidatus Cloacimonas sp.]